MQKVDITVRVRVFADGRRFALSDYERADDEDGYGNKFEDYVEDGEVPYRDIDVLVRDVELPPASPPVMEAAAQVSVPA